jgi:putative heme-binding domain-containing protein
MRFTALCILILAFSASPQSRAREQAVSPRTQSPLPALIDALSKSDDPQFQLDVLKGMTDGLKGRRDIRMPAGWDALAHKLRNSPNREIRELSRSLSVTFGSREALGELRATALNPSLDENSRRAALQTLIAAKDPGLVGALRELLKDPALRVHAIRGMGAYDDPVIPPAIIEVYPTLGTLEKKDALTTLTSRAVSAKALLAAVANQKIPPQDLTADILRLLRNLNEPSVAKLLLQQFGVARESGEDKAREIARYRGMVESSPLGDVRRGQDVFARNCQQCHVLFGTGGKVGPDLTGSDRGNIYYVLQNVIDPNAVIPNMYRSSILETKDDRVITGIVTKQDAAAVTIATATEILTIPKTDVQSLQESQLSLMPEGLIQSMSDADVRDLVAYLKSATPEKKE